MSNPIETIDTLIYVVRGQRVMLDADLARLYGVETKNLVRAVKRNLARFPGDFMFQLTKEEDTSLRCQIVTSNPGRGGRRYLPYAFTEHGTAMLASVLNTPRAVEMSVYVVRAFIKMREALSSYKELTARLDDIEQRLAGHDAAFQEVFQAIRALMERPEPPKRVAIGFRKE